MSQFGSSHDKYVNHLLIDLFGECSLLAVDQGLNQRLNRIADHDKVVDLLKSKSFFETSKGWDSDWLENKIQEISSRLNIRKNVETATRNQKAA